MRLARNAGGLNPPGVVGAFEAEFGMQGSVLAVGMEDVLSGFGFCYFLGSAGFSFEGLVGLG